MKYSKKNNKNKKNNKKNHKKKTYKKVSYKKKTGGMSLSLPSFMKSTATKQNEKYIIFRRNYQEKLRKIEPKVVQILNNENVNYLLNDIKNIIIPIKISTDYKNYYDFLMQQFFNDEYTKYETINTKTLEAIKIILENITKQPYDIKKILIEKQLINFDLESNSSKIISNLFINNKQKIKSIFLNTICSNSGFCLAFGKETDTINEYFNNFSNFNYIEYPVTHIGSSSSNGFILKINYNRNNYRKNLINEHKFNQSNDKEQSYDVSYDDENSYNDEVSYEDTDKPLTKEDIKNERMEQKINAFKQVIAYKKNNSNIGTSNNNSNTNNNLNIEEIKNIEIIKKRRNDN